MNGKWISVLTVVFLLGLVAFPDRAQAADVSWRDAATGNWNDPANWDSGTVPGALDNVSITVGGTYTVTLSEDATVARLTVGAPSGMQTLAIGGRTFTLNGASSITSNGVLNFTGGVLTSNGELTVTGILDWRAGTMSGTGKIAVASGGLLDMTVARGVLPVLIPSASSTTPAEHPAPAAEH